MGGKLSTVGPMAPGRMTARVRGIALAIAGAALLSLPASQLAAKKPTNPPPTNTNSGGGFGSSTPPGNSSGSGTTTPPGNSGGTTTPPGNSGGSSSGGSSTGTGNPADSVTVTKDQDLRFGKLVMTSTSGVVVVPADGIPTYSGAVSIGSASSVGPARFEIKGPANRSIELQLTFPLSGTYGTNGTAKLDSLSVAADFTTGFSQSGTMVRVKLDSSGTNAITVGGQLTFARNDAYGTMNILFPVNASVVQ